MRFIIRQLSIPFNSAFPWGHSRKGRLTVLAAGQSSCLPTTPRNLRNPRLIFMFLGVKMGKILSSKSTKSDGVSIDDFRFTIEY
jgi:hypothetical protein